MSRPDPHPEAPELQQAHAEAVVLDNYSVGMDLQAADVGIGVVAILGQLGQSDFRSSDKSLAELPEKGRVDRERLPVPLGPRAGVGCLFGRL